jgi:hypothetical protein
MSSTVCGGRFGRAGVEALSGDEGRIRVLGARQVGRRRIDCELHARERIVDDARQVVERAVVEVDPGQRRHVGAGVGELEAHLVEARAGHDLHRDLGLADGAVSGVVVADALEAVRHGRGRVGGEQGAEPHCRHRRDPRERADERHHPS